MITIEHDRDNFIVCRASGTLTRKDYEAAVPELDQAIALREGQPRLLILLEDFRGWEIEALWPELRTDLKYRSDFDRVAVAGESNLEHWATVLSKPFFRAEVRYFDRDDLAAAEAWLSH